MSTLTSMFRKGLLAVALAASAFGASAAPTTYHVNLDTRSITGGTYLDFAFSAYGGAALSTLTVSNLTGGPVTADDFGGADTVATATGFAMSNSTTGFNYFDYVGTIASLFSFDVTFDDAYLSGPAGIGSLFYISILGANLDAVTDGNAFAKFDLSSDAGIVATVAPGFGDATVKTAEVPEPAALLLLLTGFALMGVMVKRRQG